MVDEKEKNFLGFRAKFFTLYEPTDLYLFGP